ncbi:MAG: hypothetical protein ABI867_28565, partial [Kofleriaceae bacterium]
MARGIARAPSQNAFRGGLGRTQTTTVHVTGPRGELVAAQVHTTIDAVSDPELVDRLHAEDLAHTLNTVRFGGSEPVRVAVPVLYHDPAAELFVLVLDTAHRHRELEERIAVLEKLRREDSAIPAYVKDFAVVFGAPGLEAYLEQRAQQALETARLQESSRDSDRRRADLSSREGDLERSRIELDKRAREFERANTELTGRQAEVERSRIELARERGELDRLRSEARNRVIAAAQTTADTTVISPAPLPPVAADREDSNTAPVPKQAAIGHPRADSEGFEAEAGVADAAEIRAGSNGKSETPISEADVDVEFSDDETTGSSIVPQGSDPLTTETVEVPGDGIDPWLERVAGNSTSTFGVVGGSVRLALVAGEQIARGLGGMIDVRIVLHRVASYPVIAFIFGPPAALRVPSPTQLAIVPIDIANDTDRQVLGALAKRFEVAVDLIVRGRRIRKVRLTAPLTENVGFIMRAAEDHLRGVSAEGEASFTRGVDQVRSAGYDLLGTNHPDTAEFRDDKLAQLETAQQLRRAIAMARRYARPSREDYLVCTRGFPLPR